MSDAQDELVTDQVIESIDTIANDTSTDEVTDVRSSGMRRSLLVFVVLGGLVVGASWYYQTTWLPQVQNGVQFVKVKFGQSQAWLDDIFSSSSPHNIDRMAAPRPQQFDATLNIEKLVDNNAYIPKEDEALGIASNVKIPEVPIVIEKPAEQELPVLEILPATDIEQVEPDVVMDKVIEEQNKVIIADVVATSVPTVTSKSTVTFADARQAFWQRELPKAESLYQQINKSQANANSWGELGNVYYLQAKWQLAASAYTEAALILLSEGNIPQAMFLRYIVVGLDLEQVQRIDERIRELQTPQQG